MPDGDEPGTHITERSVVVGGGYAGVMAANRLTGRGGVKVTLINPCPACPQLV